MYHLTLGAQSPGRNLHARALLHIMEHTQGKLHTAPTGTPSAEMSVQHDQHCTKGSEFSPIPADGCGFKSEDILGQNMIQHGLLPSNHTEASLLCYSLPIKSHL